MLARVTLLPIFTPNTCPPCFSYAPSPCVEKQSWQRSSAELAPVQLHKTTLTRLTFKSILATILYGIGLGMSSRHYSSTTKPESNMMLLYLAWQSRCRPLFGSTKLPAIHSDSTSSSTFHLAPLLIFVPLKSPQNTSYPALFWWP
jgi:hypothetical protein